MSRKKEIESQIRELEKEWDLLDKQEREQDLMTARNSKAVKVVCGYCGGQGVVSMMSYADNAIMDKVDCDVCDGRGFHYMQEFDTKGEYPDLGVKYRIFQFNP